MREDGIYVREMFYGEHVEDCFVNGEIVWTKRYYTIRTRNKTGHVLASYTPFVDDNIHGTEKNYFKSGKLAKTIDWKNGRMDGTYIAYHQNGNIKKMGTMKDNHHIGQWVDFNKDGLKNDDTSIITKDVTYDDNGRKVGRSITRDNAGNLKKECFYDTGGRLHGDVIEYYKPAEKILHCEWKYQKGLRVGVQKNYHSNGILSKIETYKLLEYNDRKRMEHLGRWVSKSNSHGKYVEYNFNGKVSTTGYKDNGVTDGLFLCNIDRPKETIAHFWENGKGVKVITNEMMKLLNVTIYDAMKSNDLTLVKELCKIFQYKLIEDKYFVKV